MSSVAELARTTPGRVVSLVLMVSLVLAAVVLHAAHDRKVAEELTIPKPPADAPAIGMYVRSHVLPNDRIRVDQWISSAAPIRELAVRTTDPNHALGTVVARGLEVLGDDGVLARRREINTQVQHVTLRKPAKRLYLSYVILGGVNDRGSVQRRVLARVISLDVDYKGASGPVKRRIETEGGQVLVMGCLPHALNANPSACGQATSDGAWEVMLVGKDRDDHVIASLELGKASAQ